MSIDLHRPPARDATICHVISEHVLFVGPTKNMQTWEVGPIGNAFVAKNSLPSVFQHFNAVFGRFQQSELTRKYLAVFGRFRQCSVFQFSELCQGVN